MWHTCHKIIKIHLIRVYDNNCRSITHNCMYKTYDKICIQIVYDNKT